MSRGARCRAVSSTQVCWSDPVFVVIPSSEYPRKSMYPFSRGEPIMAMKQREGSRDVLQSQYSQLAAKPQTLRSRVID